MFKVSVIIPNHNGLNLLKNNLPKTLISLDNKTEIIVADDASDDGSVDFVKSNFPQIKICQNLEHSGFSGNVNQGVNQANGEIVVLLNTDVVPRAGFLKPLIMHFQDPEVFAVGCLDISHENNKTVKRGRGLGWWDRGIYIHKKGDPNQTDTSWVSGGSGAFRKSIWLKLGGMDEIYNPFYWEDIDLSYRARKSGYRIIFENSSVVDHYHQAGNIKTNYTENFVKTISYRNQFIFIWKNLTDVKLIIEHIIWLPVHLFKAMWRGDREFIKGYFLALSKLAVIIKKRQSASIFFCKKDRDL